MTSHLSGAVKVLRETSRFLSVFGFDYRHKVNRMNTVCSCMSKSTITSRSVIKQ